MQDTCARTLRKAAVSPATDGLRPNSKETDTKVLEASAARGEPREINARSQVFLENAGDSIVSEP